MSQVFQQDLTDTSVRPGGLFFIELLMAEHCDMPDRDTMVEVLTKHLGPIDCFDYRRDSAGFAPQNYKVHYEDTDADISPMLMVTDCEKIDKPVLDDFERSQVWDCPNVDEVLAECQYRVFATDMLASGLEAKERADMLVRYVDALLELYPSCKAVVFGPSHKLLSRESIENHSDKAVTRFIYYAVNVRYFSIQGTNDMMVDSVGMSTLFLPDLQYHFHGVDPNHVVFHAYNVLNYIFEHDNPIGDGETIAGLQNGEMNQDIQWKVQYEDSLIQSVREVLDINMGEYASGTR
ncbi:DUF4261 domain-containing protein [Veillonella parvula]|uniref:DUF4261 domain-containing protein n=1 Tax=Veillonella parvula TaxID=29466 RepID=UPI0026F02482|nr:DUF4261 domain-containing protein [Veillonella parvula]